MNYSILWTSSRVEITGTLMHQCTTRSGCVFFQIPPVRPSYRAIFTGRQHPKHPKAGNSCVKKGVTFTFPKKELLYLDAEFDGEFLFLLLDMI